MIKAKTMKDTFFNSADVIVTLISKIFLIRKNWIISKTEKRFWQNSMKTDQKFDKTNKNEIQNWNDG